MRAFRTTLRRTARQPNSLHYVEPRLLRVTLHSADETESILLVLNRHHRASNGVCTLPDIPWKERSKDMNNQQGSRKHSLKTVIIHGFPESQASSPEEVQAHDLVQWRYIREALSSENVISISLTRIPVSLNYKWCGPRSLKLVLPSELTLQSVLEN
ncbi:unnamed protein product [Dicrocoelium dendriticum]|nr:unnamed protein product [Dicrocoelium dendriticum]